MHELYADIMHTLLQGDIIDEYRHPELYRALQNNILQDTISEQLRLLKRELCHTDNHSGYYLAYSEQPSKAEREQLREQFKHFAADIAPLVEWLRLTRSTNPDNRPIQSGDTVNQSELLKQIEQSPHLEAQLKDIARAFNSSASNSKEQLNSLLEKLKNKHYFIAVGSSGAVYRATAKWDLFYEQMEYLQNAANIPLPSLPSQQQGELL